MEETSSSFQSVHAKNSRIGDLQDTKRAEDIIGTSLSFLTRMDPHMWDSSARNATLRGRRLAFAVKLVDFFKEFYERNRINVLVNTIEDDIVSVVAFNLAKKMDITIIGQVSGRFPRRGVMFARDYSDICQWREEDVGWTE